LANWPARIVLGAISSTYSILISRIAAARIGRDAAVEWMSVAAIPARDRVLQVEPSRTTIAIEIAFHQCAKCSWVASIGVCGGWTTWLVTSRHRLDRYFQGSPDVALEWFAPVVLSFCAADIHVAAAILDRPAGAGVLRTDVLRPSAREPFARGLDRRVNRRAWHSRM
jgi:hypothetical protein